MIPHVARRGHSFKGAGQYYLHDKEASTSERVAWTHTHNVPTNDPEKAFKWMTWTAMHADELKAQAGTSRAGRKATAGSVYSFSLAWHPDKEQAPDQEGMLASAFETLERLGLKEHEAVIVAHQDTDHPHVHVITNLVHPETGRTAVPSYDRLTLSTWAEQHERRHNGGEVICQQRAENNERRREEAKKDRQLALIKHREAKAERARQIQELYRASDSGKAFQAALEEAGYTLAQGDRRGFVLVDQDGAVCSLSRQLKRQRAKDIKACLSDLDHKTLPEAKTLADERQYFDRDRYNMEQQRRTEEAAIEHEKDQEQQKQFASNYKSFAENLDPIRERDNIISLERAKKEAELKAFYNRDQLAAELEAKQSALAQKKGVIGNITSRNLESQIDALQKQLANIDQRIGEQWEAFDRRMEQQWPDVYRKQAAPAPSNENTPQVTQPEKDMELFADAPDAGRDFDSATTGESQQPDQAEQIATKAEQERLEAERDIPNVQHDMPTPFGGRMSTQQWPQDVVDRKEAIQRIRQSLDAASKQLNQDFEEVAPVNENDLAQEAEDFLQRMEAEQDERSQDGPEWGD